MFAISPAENDDFNTPESPGMGHKSKRSLTFSSPVMFLYFADHLRMSASKDWGYLGRIADIEIEETTLGVFLRTNRYGVLSRSTSDDITRVCREGGILVPFAPWMVRKWFEMGIINVSPRMHCSPNLAALAIPRLVEVNRDATDVESFRYDFDRTKFTFIHAVPAAT